MAAAAVGAGNFPDEQIIRHVRNHSCLYNPREQEYKDSERKAAVWREIAANVGMTGKNLKFRYRKKCQKSLYLLRGLLYA